MVGPNDFTMLLELYTRVSGNYRSCSKCGHWLCAHVLYVRRNRRHAQTTRSMLARIIPVCGQLLQ
jgi:hypothetical protein